MNTTARIRRLGAGLWDRPEAQRLLEIFVLTGFAVVQPLLDVTGRSPDFFLFRKAGRADIVVFAVAVVVVLPVVAWGLGAVTRFAGERVRRAVHLATLGALALLLAVQVGKEFTGLRGTALLAVAVAAAAALVALLVRAPAARTWFRYAAVGPPLFCLLFLVTSPTANLVLPGRGGVAALSPAEATAPVVFLLFDEFPLRALLDADGDIDESLYPNFARLASGTDWYRNATSTMGLTPHAVPSLLTGRLPEESRAPAASQYPDNLFTLFSQSHDLHVYESVTALCPPDLCETTAGVAEGRTGLRSLIRDGFDVYRRIAALHEVDEDPVGAWLRDETVAERDGEAPVADPAGEPEPDDLTFRFDRLRDNQPARVRDFLESIDGRGRPLHFLHLLLPHAPWRYLPSGEQYRTRDFLNEDDAKTVEAWPWTNARQRLLLQTAYLDGLLGEVLDRLERTGLYDRAAVVVTADHGLSLIPGEGQPSKAVTGVNNHEVAWVPLFVKAPGQTAGQVVDDNAWLVDVLPTLAGILDVDIPWDVHGVDLRRDGRDDDRKLWFNKVGTPIEFDGGDYFARVLDGMASDIARPDLGVEGLYRVGRSAGLVGEVAPDATGGEAEPAGSVVLDEADGFRRVHLGGGELPALVSGVVELPGGGDGAAGRAEVAIAVNGRIAGVSTVFPLRGEDRFVTVARPDLFRQGRNRVDVFLVEGDGADLRLRPLEARS